MGKICMNERPDPLDIPEEQVTDADRKDQLKQIKSELRNVIKSAQNLLNRIKVKED